ncbi:uncharacterized protein LOC106636870 [Copidosoma floridanum]|uniref:uncharacterized protein LOC106636870 n=1 Tax=Copidosoma floridanum TaxID=29053 RepID=UPI0006C9734A|nr:uncharacterized protein LOC106636870 [Copidosoma floridanum]
MYRRMSSEPEKTTRFTMEDATAVVNELSCFEEAKVIGFELKPFSSETLGYLGRHEMLRVEARELHDKDKDAPSTRSLTFFVKSKVAGANEFDDAIFRDESKFYEDVVPKLLEAYRSELWAARCHLVKEGGGLLVLEDLRAGGYEATNRPLRTIELRSAIASLARFHATSILLEARLGKPLDQAYPGFFGEKVFVNDGGWSWKWLVTGMEVAEDVARELGLDASSVPAAYEWTIEKVLPEKHRGRNVLVHCDLWYNNLMFSESGSRCRLVDFQMTTYASYAVDLAQIVYLNTGVEARRRTEAQLIGLYHRVLVETLSEHGYAGKPISLDEVARDFEDKRIYGSVVAVQFLPIVLWGKEMAEKYASPDTGAYHMYTSRVELVRSAMQRDRHYRRRIEEVVRDLVECAEGCLKS